MAEAARRIVYEQEGEERDDASALRAASSRVISNWAGPPPRLRSITALKEDGTYLVQQSSRSRCVSLTKEAIASVEGGAALLTAFAATHRAELVVQKKATTKHRAVLGVCGRRGKQHQAQLEGNTTWRWFSTAQLLLWNNGRAKVEEYDALHPESTVNQEEQLAVSEARELTYFIDMMSREPLTDPYTLRHGDHSESYNRDSWQSLLDGRRTCSPVLRAPIEFYRADGLAVFLPQPDPALKAEVALWLLTLEGQAYAAEVDSICVAAVKSKDDVSAPRMKVKDPRATTQVAMEQCGGDSGDNAVEMARDRRTSIRAAGDRHLIKQVETPTEQREGHSSTDQEINDKRLLYGIISPEEVDVTVQLDDVNHQVNHQALAGSITVDQEDTLEMRSQQLERPASSPPAYHTGSVAESRTTGLSSITVASLSEVESEDKLIDSSSPRMRVDHLLHSSTGQGVAMSVAVPISTTAQLDDVNHHQVNDNSTTADKGDMLERGQQQLNAPVSLSSTAPTDTLPLKTRPFTHNAEVEAQLKAQLLSSRAEVEKLRAELEKSIAFQLVDTHLRTSTTSGAIFFIHRRKGHIDEGPAVRAEGRFIHQLPH